MRKLLLLRHVLVLPKKCNFFKGSVATAHEQDALILHQVLPRRVEQLLFRVFLRQAVGDCDFLRVAAKRLNVGEAPLQRLDDVQHAGVEKLEDCDMVILAAGYRGTDKLSAAIEAERPNIELHVIGDATRKRMYSWYSIQEGNRAGQTI